MGIGRAAISSVQHIPKTIPISINSDIKLIVGPNKTICGDTQYSIRVPTNLYKFVDITAYGGGAGGGGGGSAVNFHRRFNAGGSGGGGGGGGALLIKRDVPISAGNEIFFQVGTGGSGGNPSLDGNNGNDSFVIINNVKYLAGGGSAVGTKGCQAKMNSAVICKGNGGSGGIVMNGDSESINGNNGCCGQNSMTQDISKEFLIAVGMKGGAGANQVNTENTGGPCTKSTLNAAFNGMSPSSELSYGAGGSGGSGGGVEIPILPQKGGSGGNGNNGYIILEFH
jgi:hypothetical protein